MMSSLNPVTAQATESLGIEGDSNRSDKELLQEELLNRLSRMYLEHSGGVEGRPVGESTLPRMGNEVGLFGGDRQSSDELNSNVNARNKIIGMEFDSLFASEKQHEQVSRAPQSGARPNNSNNNRAQKNTGPTHAHKRSMSGGSALGNQDGGSKGGNNVEKVKRTVYVADVHYQVSEQELALFFGGCGQIIDYRICGDTNTVLRFAFIEFGTEQAAKEALKLTGSILGECAIRVSPSKTAIIPVKDQFLPRSEREREAVARTVYVANIHQSVERDVLRQFFQMVCGPVSKIRLLGDAQHDTKIAFVEFTSKDSAEAALRCTGAMLGALAIRVSPSKTPVRTDARRRNADMSHLPSEAVTVAAKLTKQIRHGGSGSRNASKGSNNANKNNSANKELQHDVPASPTILSLLEGILSD